MKNIIEIRCRLRDILDEWLAAKRLRPVDAGFKYTDSSTEICGSKEGEANYFDRLPPDAKVHAVGKPFSDPRCGDYLMDLGQIMSLLPPPPASLLDFGCGTGWTSWFFARAGYDVAGADISADMIREASERYRDLPNLRFVVSDYENPFQSNPFDCIVFYDCLHHAEDEKKAIETSFKLLAPGGMIVLVEPGAGHARNSRKVAREYGTFEKDMPPVKTVPLLLQAGFRSAEIHPRFSLLQRLIATTKSYNLGPLLRARHNGIVVAYK